MKNKMNVNGMDYVLAGDYYIPVLKLSGEERSIGKYGRMHREYLKEHNPMLYNDLILTCKLWTYLAGLNEQAQKRLKLIIEQMKGAEGVTEEQKELFSRYTDAVHEHQTMAECLLFQSSFKLGASMMVEVME